MASMIQKQLVEFLKEQQEPFVLEAYLLERGCCYHSQKNRFHSSDVSSCYCSSTMAKPSCLKRSFGWGLKRNRKFIPNCSKVVRALFTKLVTVHNNQKHGNHQKKIRHQNTCAADIIDKGRHEIADEDNFSSSASSTTTTTTVFNSCPESDAEHAHCSPAGNSDIFLAADHQESLEVVYVLTENEVVAGWKFRRRNGEEDSKQLSPVSVLEETESYSGSPVEGEFTTKQKGELNLKKSVSRCIEEKEKPIHKRKTLEEVEDFVGSNSNSNNNDSSHYSKNKKAVQQTKQLLFDCIREVVELEKHKKEKKKKKESSEGQQQSKGILGSEQLWELICENLCSWSKESINETNIIHLLHSEVLLVSSAQEWKWSSDLEKQTQGISSQLGDAILEDICNGIILEMIIFCTDK